MDWEGWTTIGVLVIVLALMAANWVGTDVVLCGGLALLVALQIVSPAEALSGLANEGMVTVGVLFIVAAGLRETGGMSLIASRLLGRSQSERTAQIRLMAPVVAMSAFLNNTPLVAMLLPVVRDWARLHRISPSKLLMPLSYASILGGACTLIGTSTNLVIVGLLRSAPDLPTLELFDIAWVGLPCALIGLVYIVSATPWLLRSRRPAISDLDDPREYSVEMSVDPSGPLVGQTIEAAGLRHLPGMYLMEINRNGQILAAVSPLERLAANDQLVFVGIVESVVDLHKIRGLVPASDQLFKLDAPRSERCLIEAVVSDTCPIVGLTIRDGHFRALYNAVVVAVARNGERLHKKMGDIVLRAGDTLLLEARPSFVERQRNSRDFFLVSRIKDSTPPRYEKVWISLAILTGMVAVVALGLLPIFTASLLAAGLMMMTRCCSATLARRSVDWQVLLTIAAAFGIERALQKTGAASVIADTLLASVAESPVACLALVYGLTMLFSNMITNNAAAVLMFPVARAAAESLGVNPMPFVVALMMGASCSFATPISYQTNLMVFGPGGYRFLDYLRLGGPLSLVLWISCIWIIPEIWPF